MDVAWKYAFTLTRKNKNNGKSFWIGPSLITSTFSLWLRLEWLKIPKYQQQYVKTLWGLTESVWLLSLQQRIYNKVLSWRADSNFGLKYIDEA